MTKKIITPIELCKMFLSKSDKRPILKGLYYKDKNTILATDSYMAIEHINLNHNEHFVGLTIDPLKLEVIDGNYPDFKKQMMTLSDEEKAQTTNIEGWTTSIYNKDYATINFKNGQHRIVHISRLNTLLKVRDYFNISFYTPTDKQCYLYAINDDFTILCLCERD